MHAQMIMFQLTNHSESKWVIVKDEIQFNRLSLMMRMSALSNVRAQPRKKLPYRQ